MHMHMYMCMHMHMYMCMHMVHGQRTHFYRYTHFFYTLSPVPPHQLLATSAEFCAGAMQDSTDCESVQFISGLAWDASHGTRDESNLTDAGGDLVLSFGVNDCESRLGKVGLAQVWSMLKPLPCTTPPCAACVEV